MIGVLGLTFLWKGLDFAFPLDKGCAEVGIEMISAAEVDCPFLDFTCDSSLCSFLKAACVESVFGESTCEYFGTCNVSFSRTYT